MCIYFFLELSIELDDKCNKKKTALAGNKNCKKRKDIPLSASSVSNLLTNNEQTYVLQLMNKIETLSDKKVQIAMSAYDLIDQHILFVKEEIQLIQTAFDFNLTTTNFNLNGSTIFKNNRQLFAGQSVFNVPLVSKVQDDDDDDDNDDIPMLFTNSKDNKKSSAIPVANEPVYCVCKERSHGLMVACDNLDCAIEWFHIDCVGMTKLPKDKWYCPFCLSDKKKHKQE